MKKEVLEDILKCNPEKETIRDFLEKHNKIPPELRTTTTVSITVYDKGFAMWETNFFSDALREFADYVCEYIIKNRPEEQKKGGE